MRMNVRLRGAVCIGSPHDALELTVQPPAPTRMFMCPKGWGEHSGDPRCQPQLNAAHLSEARWKDSDSRIHHMVAAIGRKAAIAQGWLIDFEGATQ